jgi:hypothetical protein
LHDCGLSRRNIHVLAREDIPLQGLQRASVLQRSELVYGLELGLGVGGLAGMLGGLLAVIFPPAGLTLAGGPTLLGTALAGAGFCGLISALVTYNIPSHKLKPFEERILKGEILVMLDIPTDRIQMTAHLIESLYPRVDIGLTLA